MGWLALLRIVLSLANSLASIIREKQLMDAGEAKATAKALTEIVKRLDVGKDVAAQIEAMGDEELDAALRGDR